MLADRQHIPVGILEPCHLVPSRRRPYSAFLVLHEDALHIDTRALATAVEGDEIARALAVALDDPVAAPALSSDGAQMLVITPLTNLFTIVAVPFESGNPSEVRKLAGVGTTGAPL